MNQSPVTTRRTFDEAFQREAVQNWLASGKSADVIARELGLNTNLLYAWKKRWLPAAAGGRAAAGGKPSSVADLQAQLDVALRENRQLREQRDILKKNWAFSPHHPRTLGTDRRDEKRLFHPGAL